MHNCILYTMQTHSIANLFRHGQPKHAGEYPICDKEQ